jgi:cytochrome P450
VEMLEFPLSCFWEALRYYPPTTATARSLHKPLEFQLDGKTVVLPEGTRCLFSLYWIHHSKINFPWPDEYLPERWAQRGSDGKWEEWTTDNDLGQAVPIGVRTAHFAFSAGARNCVGHTLAVRMVPTIAAVLLRTFEFRLTDQRLANSDLKLERCGTSQVPTGGIPIQVRKR